MSGPRQQRGPASLAQLYREESSELLRIAFVAGTMDGGLVAARPTLLLW